MHHFCFRKSLVKCHVSQLSLLLLDFQQAGLDGVLDNKLDGRHRPCLAQAMLRENTDQPDALNNAQSNQRTMRSTAWFSTAGFL